jgi:hypothetical protein
MRTRIHPPCDLDTFKVLCTALGLRADAWTHDPEGGFISTHAYDAGGVLERHIIYRSAHDQASAERAGRSASQRAACRGGLEGRAPGSGAANRRCGRPDTGALTATQEQAVQTNRKRRHDVMITLATVIAIASTTMLAAPFCTRAVWVPEYRV